MGEEGEAPKPVPPLTSDELNVRREIHEKIFSGCDMKASARAAVEERTSLDPETTNFPRLTYAELDFDTSARIINDLKDVVGGLVPGGAFLDLGCGTGRVLFAAALAHPFAKCVGIEISEKLHEIAMARVNVFNTEVQEGMPEEVARVPVEVVKGDLFTEMANVAEVSVLFANATCFEESDMQTIGDFGKTCGDSVVVVTLTRMLPDTDSWALIGCTQVDAPYGQVTVFFHKKVPAEPMEKEAAQGGG